MTMVSLTKFFGQNFQSKFDHDHPQDNKIFIAKMVNYTNFIMTISIISNFLLMLLKFVSMVEISVNIDHLT
jgi:hypothetical protein